MNTFNSYQCGRNCKYFDLFSLIYWKTTSCFTAFHLTQIYNVITSVYQKVDLCTAFDFFALPGIVEALDSGYSERRLYLRNVLQTYSFKSISPPSIIIR